jgi:hypothetical protein
MPSSYFMWPRGLRRKSAAERLLGSWVRIPAGAYIFCLVQCLCCQVEVSATGRSLIQRSPTDCGVCAWVWSNENYKNPRHLLWTRTLLYVLPVFIIKTLFYDHRIHYVFCTNFRKNKAYFPTKVKWLVSMTETKCVYGWYDLHLWTQFSLNSVFKI